MKRKLNLWTLRGSDFSQPNWHAVPTAGYQLMFEFLRLSPSYELARKARTKGLSEAEKLKLPTDFELVLKTYDLLGDVNLVLFRTWWLRCGLQVFGNPYKKPRVHIVKKLREGMSYQASDIAGDVDYFLQGHREEEGLNSSVLLSIPIDLKQTDALKQIKNILDKYKVVDEAREEKAKIKLMCKRLRADTLYKGLRLLWLKAAYRKLELWRLGVKVNLSPSYTDVLDPLAPRKNKDATEQDDRIAMGKLTFRLLKKYQLIAENAARGKFPVDEKVEMSEFKYAEIAQRLLLHSKWVREEKARLKDM